MSDGRKTTSIARRIAWRFQWRGLWRALWQTALLGAAALGGWCFAVVQIAGRAGGVGIREISLGAEAASLSLTRETIVRELAGEGVFNRAVVLRMTNGSVAYMGDFVFWLCLCLGGILALRLLWWILTALGATNRIRRYLRPIDDIAQVTESISSRGFDESKFHSLEEAIDHLSVSGEEQLHIGDDDLAGLETAVNNLIVRMHNGYRQQVRFVDDASHELRTPIAVIGGYADMLDRWGKDDPQVLEESIRAIRTETEHMRTLVEQLLFLARGDAGRQKLDRKRLDMTGVLREVWEESRMIDDRHEYVLRESEPVFVTGDEALLKQAVRILTDNAAKYSPEGSRITFRAYREGGSVCVDVQDNGIGVSRADAERMFDRFYRADAARNSETGGSGLGLSIARWIVDRHGGRFRVISREEIGTRVTIVLPAAAA